MLMARMSSNGGDFNRKNKVLSIINEIPDWKLVKAWLKLPLLDRQRTFYLLPKYVQNRYRREGGMAV